MKHFPNEDYNMVFNLSECLHGEIYTDKLIRIFFKFRIFNFKTSKNQAKQQQQKNCIFTWKKDYINANINTFKFFTF